MEDNLIDYDCVNIQFAVFLRLLFFGIQICLKNVFWEVLDFRFESCILKGKPGLMDYSQIIRIPSFSGQYLPAFGLNTDQKNPNTDSFHTVMILTVYSL